MSFISDLLVLLRLDNRQFNSGADRSVSKLRMLDQSAAQMSKSMQFAGIMGLAYMGKQALQMVYDLGKTGAMVERMETSFRELARQAGGSADEMLAAIRRATDGTVSEAQMIAAANKGIMLGLGAQAEQWEKLAEVARFRARAMGISTTQALNDIAMGIGRESRMILDNLGIILDIDKATEQYAATLNKAVGELSAFERKQAITNAVIQEGQSMIAEAGGITEDAADSFERLEAKAADLGATVAERLAPPFSDLIDQLSGTVDAVTPLLSSLAEGVGSDLNDIGRLITLFSDSQRADFMTKWALEANGANASMEQLIATARYAKRDLLADFLGMDSLRQFGIELRDLDKYIRLSGEELLALGIAGRRSFDEIQAAAADLDIELPADAWAQWANAADAAASEGERWRQLMPQVAAATAEAGKEAELAGYRIGSLSARMEMGERAAQRYAGKMDGVRRAVNDVKRDLASLDLDEIQSSYSGAAGQIISGLAGASGNMGLESAQATYDKYLGQLDILYDEVRERHADGTAMTELELAYRQNAIVEAFNDELRALEDAGEKQGRVLEKMASQYDNLRGTVESALKPTGVTALDMVATDLGDYVNKWDENARRLDAIAQRGFEELSAHPDWAEILGIPANVLAGSEEQLKAWAGSVSDKVRSLMRPDLIDVGTAADAVEQYMRDLAAREVTIDLVVKELKARGGVSEEDARKQVLEMYGLEKELPVSLGLVDGAVDTLITSVGTPTVPVNLTVATDEGQQQGASPLLDLSGQAQMALDAQGPELIAIGGQVNDLLAEGAREKAGTMMIGSTFVDHLFSDLRQHHADLRRFGGNIWSEVARGFEAAMHEWSLMDIFLDDVVPLIARRLMSEYVWEGG